MTNHYPSRHAAPIIALFPVIVALVVPVNEPIVRRDDRPDSAYCKLGSWARALVSIGGAGDGTLIALGTRKGGNRHERGPNRRWKSAWRDRVVWTVPTRNGSTSVLTRRDVFTRVSTHAAWNDSVMAKFTKVRSVFATTSESIECANRRYGETCDRCGNHEQADWSLHYFHLLSSMSTI